MSLDAVKRWSEIHGIAYDPSLHSDSLSVLEGIDVFNRILASPFSRLVVSPNDLPTLLKDSQRHFGPALRASLQRPAHKRPELGSNYAAANSQTEEILVRIWQELLGLEPIGIHDNFFELGGHSLIAAQLLSRVRDTFHVALPVRVIFDRQTIEQLSDLVTERASKAIKGEGVMNALRDVESLSDDEARRMLGDTDT
jgi:acyl carrier protein